MRQKFDRKRTHRHDEEPSERETDAAPSTNGSSLAEEIDEILDEIDSVLEENAEEFVKAYVQKGGQ